MEGTIMVLIFLFIHMLSSDPVYFGLACVVYAFDVLLTEIAAEANGEML